MLNEYRIKLSGSLKTFKDWPEPIIPRIINTTPCALIFEWDQPDSNNSKIHGYSIYLNDI